MAAPSTESLEVLRDLVARHAAAGDADLSALSAIASERRLAKGEALLRAGERARLAAVVVEGFHGEFYELDDGKRKAKWLAGPGDVLGSMEDLVSQQPARTTIEALTDGRVLCLPYRKLRELAMTDLSWAGFFISMMEQLYRRKSEREYTLLMLKAEDRYAWFRQHYGAMEPHLSQEIVASYLGITPVHLSRVRGSRRLR